MKRIDSGRTQNLSQLFGIGNIVSERVCRDVQRKWDMPLIVCACRPYIHDANGAASVSPYHLAAPKLQPFCFSHQERGIVGPIRKRSEEHTSQLQTQLQLLITL